MRKLLIRMFTLLIYILALLGLVRFKLGVLFNLKMMLMVGFGTILLTLSSYKKGMTLEDMKAPASWNAMLTSYLTSFVLLFSRLSGSSDYNNLMYDVAMNCRPLLYGLIINILLKSELPKGKKEEEQDKTGDILEHIQASAPKLQEAGLTEREIEIAICICQGMSNKEIGEKLFISESTVKKHTSNFYKKLNIENREQLKQYIKSL